MKRPGAIGLGVLLAVLAVTPIAANGLYPHLNIPASVFQQQAALKAKARVDEAFRAGRRALFDAMDTDHDGTLTTDEIPAAWEGYFATLDRRKTREVSAADCAAMLEAEFKIMDGQDQDGRMTFDEYMTYWTTREP